MPAVGYDACDKRTTRVTSLSLVRYRTNDYSVPTRYGHREVLLRAYVDEVVICRGSEEIARHRRSYEREELIFDPLHYLALLERKTNALDQAAPLVGWPLPEELVRLGRLLEVRLGKAGKREYVQVLRLLEDFPLPDVAAAARQAHAQHSERPSAVVHVLCSKKASVHSEGHQAGSRLDDAVGRMPDVVALILVLDPQKVCFGGRRLQFLCIYFFVFFLFHIDYC